MKESAVYSFHVYENINKTNKNNSYLFQGLPGSILGVYLWALSLVTKRKNKTK
jgi:hypothetical protein